jgi:hypothetical protein
MDLRKHLTQLSYLGKVQGQRQTYQVFEGGDRYLIASTSRSKPNAGYFNLVEKSAVDYVLRRVAGERGVTSKAVVQQTKRSKHVVDSLLALNILYVLVALGKANIDRKREGRKLYFNVRAS